jgi:rare lipoprotein A
MTLPLFCRAACRAFALLVSLSAVAAAGEVKGDFSAARTGVASWYGGSWIGKLTANGEPYGAADMTAAHRSLPFGTMVRVTNLGNLRSTVVRINNRGPFVKGRLLDVSKKAATLLGMMGSGTARVKLEVIPRGEGGGERFRLEAAHNLPAARGGLDVRLALAVQPAAVGIGLFAVE